MSKELVAKYKYEVGPLEKYSTEYKWILNDWSLMYDLMYKEGVTSSDFDVNGIDGCTCRILLSPKTPEKILNIEFSNTQDIEAIEMDIRMGDTFWQENDRKPVSKIYFYELTSKKDLSTGISKTDANGAVVIRVKITIVKVSDSMNLLNQMTLPHQMLSRSNFPQNNLANIKTMFDLKAFCDITFVLGDKKFHAHKVVLAAQSKVFEAMFSSGMKEQNDNTIKISNFDAEVFEQFLNYLYGGEGIQLDEKVEEMIVIADFYNVSELKIRCENIMLKSLSKNSAIRYVILADKINCNTLKAAALHLIRKSSRIIEKAVLEEDTVTMTDLKEVLSKNRPEA